MQLHTPDHQTTRLTWTYAIVLGVLIALYKVLPRYLFDPTGHPVWNFVPMGALALFVGSRLRSPLAFLVPVVAMFVGDLLLVPSLAAMGYQAFSWGTPVIYACYALYVLLGRLIPQQSLSAWRIVGAGLLGSIQFFLITNFLCWPGSSMYPQTFDGLMTCYAMALPFFRSTLTSDLIFPLIFFAVHAAMVRGLVARSRPVEQPA